MADVSIRNVTKQFGKSEVIHGISCDIRDGEFIVILGPAIILITAAIYAARANLKPTLVMGLQPGGQLTITTDVENYPGFAETVQGPWLMEQFQKQAEHVGASMVWDTIVDVDLSERPFKLTGDGGTVYVCDTLVIDLRASRSYCREGFRLNAILLSLC